MKTEEAIKWVDDRMCFGRGTFTEHHPPNIDECWQAGMMAIKALRREEAEEKGYCHRIRPSNVEVVVRCKDCKWYMLTDHNDTEVCTNKQWDISMAIYPIISADGFCSYGERREK